MSETVSTDVPKPAPPAQEAPGDEAKPQETDVDWKAKAREWERRAKENKSAADELSAIKESQKSEAEKAAELLAEAERKAVVAEARALRREVALEHKLSAADAALLDTITDEGAMRALAERLATTESDKKRNNFVPREGDNHRPGDDPMRAFARDLFDRAAAD